MRQEKRFGEAIDVNESVVHETAADMQTLATHEWLDTAVCSCTFQRRLLANRRT